MFSQITYQRKVLYLYGTNFMKPYFYSNDYKLVTLITPLSHGKENVNIMPVLKNFTE